MSKQKRLLIVLAAAIVLLGVSIAVLLLSGQSDGDNQQSGIQTQTLTLFSDAQAGTLVSAAIETPQENYEISLADGTYAVAGLDQVRVSQQALTDFFTTLQSLQLAVIQDADLSDPAQYGLDNPTAVLTLTLADNTAAGITVGTRYPFDDLYYCSIEGVDSPCLIASDVVQTLLAGKEQWRDKSLFPALSADNIQLLTKVSVTSSQGTNFTVELSNELDADGYLQYFLTEPVHQKLDLDAVAGKLLSYLTFVSGDAVLAEGVTDTSGYGFENPYAVIELVLDGKTDRILLGDQIPDNTEYRYVMLDGGDTVYSFKAFREMILTTDLTELVGSNVVEYPLADVGQFTLTADGKTDVFRYAEDGVTRNGQLADSTKLTALYDSLRALSFDGVVAGETPGDLQLRLDLALTDGSVVTYEFRSISDRACTVVKDGRYAFFLYNRNLQAVLDAWQAVG